LAATVLNAQVAWLHGNIATSDPRPALATDVLDLAVRDEMLKAILGVPAELTRLPEGDRLEGAGALELLEIGEHVIDQLRRGHVRIEPRMFCAAGLPFQTKVG
jgi:hypothetical protein